jgi:NADH-quinone oxidoreductase subunit C
MAAAQSPHPLGPEVSKTWWEKQFQKRPPAESTQRTRKMPMNENLQAAVQALVDRFDLTASEFRGENTLIVSPENIVPVCEALKSEFKFDRLSALTGVDYWPQMEPRFHIIYRLYSLEDNSRVGLRLPVPGLHPVVPTVEGVYRIANWMEREVWDMFGIRFEGHSDLRRILMPADWEGHPLRKDYPLGYEEVQFSFNVDEVQARKPLPRE